MNTLTICMTTSRPDPKIGWMLDTLIPQLTPTDKVEVLVISLHDIPKPDETRIKVRYFKPKPNVWQGEHRVTKDDWWAVSNARNTGLCLCETEWIVFIDDRCRLSPEWMLAVREAMAGNYIMAGSYEKWHGEVLAASDSRNDSAKGRVVRCPGEWMFGCCVLLPLEYALRVNGYPEKCDSVSFEDVIFGLLLQNNSLQLKYDPRAKIIEDRTPGEIGVALKRSSKEKHPHDTSDKTHTILNWARTAKRSDNGFDIRELRAKILAGGEFPVPDKSIEHRDWFDSQLISEF